MRVLVVGGGIGGLAAAIGIRRSGHEVAVFEQAPAFERVGYGIGLSPNAILALSRLGVADAVRSHGAPAERIVIRSWRGRTLSEVCLAKLGWEMLGVHRADLQGVLRSAAGDDVRFGARCVGFDVDDTGVAVRLANRSVERGDLLVGADGIDSVVCRHLHGPGTRRYAGHVGWRASVPFEHDSIWRAMTESWGPDARFGLVPIGKGQVYWFVAEVGPAGAPDPPEGPKEAFLRRFADWHEPIAAVIAATAESSISRTDVFDRPPLARWGEGRATLLGDAAHPMTPNLGQGAAQALEDAVVLANRLRNATDGVAALRAYEAARIPRTTAVVNRSWQAGRLAQLRSPVARSLRDVLLRATPARVQRAQQRRIVSVELD